MINIIKIKIENFQSHVDTEFDLINGVNVIVGESDQGKTVILRAIKWVLYNEPRGLEFLRTGTDFVKVSLTFSNGYKVIREKGSKKNRYSLIDEQGQEEIFEGFGNDVPKEILDIHNIKRVSFDQDIKVALNFSEQLEGAFLLSQTGSFKAKALGTIMGLNVFDKALKDIVLDVRNDNKSLEKSNEEIDKLIDELTLYDDLEKLETTTKKLTNDIALMENSTQKLRECSRIKKQFTSINNDFKANEYIISKLNNLEKCEIIIKEIWLNLEKLKNLERINFNLKNTREKIIINEEVLSNSSNIQKVEIIIFKIEQLIKMSENLFYINEKKKQVDIDIGENNIILKKLEGINRAEKTNNSIMNMIKKVNNLSDIGKKYTEINESLRDGEKFLSSKILDAQNLLDEYLKLLKKVGKCPLCKSNISDNIVKGVIYDYKNT